MTHHLRLIVPAFAAVLVLGSGAGVAAGGPPQGALDLLLHGTPSQRAAEARFRASLPGRPAAEPDPNARRHGRHGAGAVPGTGQQ